MTPKILNTILLLVSFILYSYVAKPLYSGTSSIFTFGESIPTLSEKVASYQKTIDAYPELKNSAESALSAYKNISEEDRNKIMVMVPETVDEIKLMSELVNIGVASGIPIESMGIKDKGGYYSINFTVMAKYSDFKKVMATWENSRRLLALQNVSFSSGKTDDEVLKFTVDLVAYYLK